MAAKRQRRQFTAEYKAEAVKLVIETKLSQAQVARDLGLSESILGRWVRKARGNGTSTALSITERAELKRLQRENAVLRKERDILKKAAAFFAKEIL